MVNSLAYYITLLQRDFADYCNRELQALGLSQGQLFFLLYVGKHLDCSPGELAAALHMDTGHVTRTLCKLEQGGFLRQEINRADRRGRVLRLEERGEAAYRVSHELFTRWDGAVMDGMTDTARADLMGALRLLTEREEGKGHVRNTVQSH